MKVRQNAQYLMLKALLLSQEPALIGVITHAAPGKNNGGEYISLYARTGDYRFCAVYIEQWGGLPDEVVVKAKALASKVFVSKSVPDRKESEARGLLFALDTPFEAVRYAYKGSEKADWNFGGITTEYSDKGGARENPKPPAPPVAASRIDIQGLNPPALFEGVAHATQWAVDLTAYNSLPEAHSAYLAVREQNKPQTATAAWHAWKVTVGIKLVRECVIRLQTRAEALQWLAVFAGMTMNDALALWRELKLPASVETDTLKILFERVAKDIKHA